MNGQIPEQVKEILPARDWKLATQKEWDVEDWTDFYHGIGFALFRIARRHERRKMPPELDFQI